ncbi:MAG: hypothetical protein EBS42_09615, partial [Caulobacteraceae bacterium]|nr:hypothetical protein [Caulobacteraceae bacterium]
MTPVDIARSFQPELLARAPEIEEARRLPADLAAKLAGISSGWLARAPGPLPPVGDSAARCCHWLLSRS